MGMKMPARQIVVPAWLPQADRTISCPRKEWVLFCYQAALVFYFGKAVLVWIQFHESRCNRALFFALGANDCAVLAANTGNVGQVVNVQGRALLKQPGMIGVWRGLAGLASNFSALNCHHMGDGFAGAFKCYRWLHDLGPSSGLGFEPFVTVVLVSHGMASCFKCHRK